MNRLVSTVLCSALAYCHTLGAEFFVDFDSGDDENDGASTNSPFKTIHQMSAGDTTWLKRGCSSGSGITITNSGSVVTAGVCTSLGTGFTIVDATNDFAAKGVSTNDYVYVAGSGVYNVLLIGTTTLTVSGERAFKDTGSVGYCVFTPIMIAVKSDWGSGNTTISGPVVLSGCTAVWIDGTITNGLEIEPGADFGITSSDLGVQECLILKNCYVHGATGDNGGIYIREVNYGLIESCTIGPNGNGDGNTGDDNISIVTQADWWTIQHCDIGYAGDDNIQCAPADNCFIQLNRIHHCDSDGSHADGIAFNSTGVFDVTIRYNYIYDNASPTDWENVHFVVYGNLFYNTENINVSSNGNIGIRFKVNAYGDVFNNCFAYNTYNAIKGYNTAGSPTRIVNNLFWENQNNPGGTASGEPEINVAITNDLVLSHNLYRRVVYPATDDKIVQLGAGKYSLSEAVAIGYENGGLYYDDNTSIILETNQSTIYFKALAPSPLIDAGESLVGTIPPYDIDWKGRTGTWDIGAYEYGRVLRTTTLRAGNVTGP